MTATKPLVLAPAAAGALFLVVLIACGGDRDGGGGVRRAAAQNVANRNTMNLVDDNHVTAKRPDATMHRARRPKTTDAAASDGEDVAQEVQRLRRRKRGAEPVDAPVRLEGVEGYGERAADDTTSRLSPRANGRLTRKPRRGGAGDARQGGGATMRSRRDRSTNDTHGARSEGAMERESSVVGRFGRVILDPEKTLTSFKGSDSDAAGVVVFSLEPSVLKLRLLTFPLLLM